ncbi:unnamed protein product, partial [Closterium sp. NIES-53]
LGERFRQDIHVLRLHSDKGGEFSSNLLRDFCRGEGILQTFTLPASPQQNGISEHRIGLVMELGNVSVFRVWGSCAFVRDTSADKLSARAVPCVFLGFPPDAPCWQFYHPTLRRVFPSQDVTFDESVPFYHLFPFRSAPPPPPPLFLAPHPLPGTVPLEVAGDSGAARDAASGGAEPGGAEAVGAECFATSISPQQLREWFAKSTRLRSGAAGVGDSAAGDTGAGGVRATPLGGAGVTARAGGTGGAAAAGPRGARTRARDPVESGGAEAGGTGAGGTGAGGTCTGCAGAGGAGAVDPGAGGTGAGSAGAGGAGGVDTGAGGAGDGGAVSGGTDAGGSAATTLASPLPAPSSYTEQTGGLIERCEPESRPASLVCAVRTGRRVLRLRPPPVLGTQAMALRPSFVSLRVPLPPPPESSLPAVPDPESDLARAASPTVSRLLATVVTNPSFESTAASALIAELVDFAATCCPDYATTLVAESESASPPSVGGECALGTDVLEDRQEDFECLAAARRLRVLTPSSADPLLFLRSDTSLPPFYVLMYVHDLVLQQFRFQFSLPQPTPLSTGHSLSAPPSDESFEPSGPYPELVGCLMYLMTCTRPDLAYPVSVLARYVAPGRHRKVYWDAAKRVLRYLCSTSGMWLVLVGRGPVVLTSHADASWVEDLATQRSSQGYTFSLGSGSVSWRSTRSSSVLSSSCKAEIYAGAMAAQELCWLTYLLTDLGERPRSSPILYVDNKAMIALCQEHRLEDRMKHIALRYFLARELQQRGQLRLAYVATRANTADIFTKALQLQRFSTVLGLVPTLPHLLTV